MEQNKFKTAWRQVHQSDVNSNIKIETLSTIISQSHCYTISKVLNEIKAKIIVYSIGVITLLGLMIYAFIYLRIQLTLSIGIPFLIAGLFLVFKLLSEIIRLRILSNQNDNLSIRDATIEFDKKLNKIRNVDFLIILSIFYFFGILLLTAYLFNFNELKNWTQSTNLSETLILFTSLLFIVPWVIRKTLNQRYQSLSKNLKKSIDYFTNDVS